MEKDPGVGEKVGRRPACRKQAGGTRGGALATEMEGKRQGGGNAGKWPVPWQQEGRTEAARTGWRMTEGESGGRDGPVGEAVATRVSDERSEELARQDRSRRFPVSRDRP